MTPLIFAEASNSDVGMIVFALAALFGLMATMVSIASYFATRREVEELKGRVGKLEDDLDIKTGKIHNRVNRLLAGQMLIAGRVGCALDQHEHELRSLMTQLEQEED